MHTWNDRFRNNKTACPLQCITSKCLTTFPHTSFITENITISSIPIIVIFLLKYLLDFLSHFQLQQSHSSHLMQLKLRVPENYGFLCVLTLLPTTKDCCLADSALVWSRLGDMSTQCPHPFQLNLMPLIEIKALEAASQGLLFPWKSALVLYFTDGADSSVKLGGRKMKPEQAAPHSKEILWRKALRCSVQPRMLSTLLLSWWWDGEQQQNTGSICSC